MRQNSFRAAQWLFQDTPQQVSKNSITSTQNNVKQALEKQIENNGFQPSDFFTPGWSGESLISKNGIKIKKIVIKLWNDCIQQFRGLSQANRSLQDLIFKQFVDHCKESQTKINPLFLENSQYLLQEICLPNNKMNPVVLDFIKVSSFKSVTLFLYKVKFLSKLSDHLDLELDEQKVRNPSYIFQKIFKTTAQNSFVISSVQRNAYSWYRPSNSVGLKILPIIKVLETVSITELMKLTSFSNYIQTQKTVYPHSISHQEFGKLLNELLINFPDWIEESRGEPKSRNLDILSVKFSGEHVTSLSQSHWLAQRSSDPRSWRKLLFPEFEQENKNDLYIKYCHELQFLSFLISLSSIYKKNPVKYIIEIFREKERISSTLTKNFGQTSLFQHMSDDAKPKLYQRSVLNLPNLPKKNPHHYLTSQIINEFDHIADDGYLIILTNQKLFVPSYQEKVKQVLQISQLEAEFNLEGLKNKGELPDYLYVFSKSPKSNRFLNNSNESNKSSYISFSFEGLLSQFQLLQNFSKELVNIWNTKKATTPLFQKDLDREMVLKFHQSVILDGKTLEGESQTKNSITHPSFYKNLALNSLTLDSFFKIETSEQGELSKNERDFLFNSSQLGAKAPYVLIVHTPNYLASAIEIIHADSLEAKKQQYGEAFYQYYEISPLSRNLNINIFREYFNSNIGMQIIKLTLGGATTKIKSKIRSLLVPKSFLTPIGLTTKTLPDSFELLNLSGQSLANLTANQTEAKFGQFFDDAEELKKIDPNLLISCLSHLKIKIQHMKQGSGTKSESVINLKNNDFVSKVMSLELNPLYPNNPDSYVEFTTNDRLSLYSTASRFEIEQKDDQHVIQIFSNEECVLKIFTEKNMATFIHSLLGQFSSFKPSDVLQSLKIPTCSDLNSILDEDNKKFASLQKFSTKTDDLINSVITSVIL